jgi:DNA-binding GntR family transcriptional regulator
MAGYDQVVSLLVMEYEAMVDHGSPVAPYRQIAAVLRDRIESGEYQPGQRLPSINALMQEYGVAHLTANKALRLLITEGLAEVSPGMGYYVKSEP